MFLHSGGRSDEIVGPKTYFDSPPVVVCYHPSACFKLTCAFVTPVNCLRMMNPALVGVLVLIGLSVAILFGHKFPGDQLTAETRDTIKLAIGLIGTMTVLLLGLLVSSAKGTYDAERTQVIQMTAKVAYLNRLLSLYGPDAMDVRKAFHSALQDAIRRIWPNDKSLPAQLAPNTEAGDLVYFKIQALKPSNEAEQKLKSMVEAAAADLAQSRALLVAQSQAAISSAMLVVVISWLVIIFGGFSLIAPPNAPSITALVVSAAAVSAAIFLLLELDHPFTGLIRIPNQEMIDVLNQLPQ